MKLSTWTTEALKTEIRELESPDNWMARSGATESEQQNMLDRLCDELGRREEC